MKNKAYLISYFSIPGYFCPEGTSSPTPCPTGKYGKELRSAKPEDCFPCPSNSYNDLEGQLACKPCGSSAISTSNSDTCECIGKNRLFLKSSGKSAKLTKT